MSYALAITRPINLIVIHCSATPDGVPLTRLPTPTRNGVPGQTYKTAAQVIDEWHARRGFKRDPQGRLAFNPQLGSVGYHFIIDTSGAIFTGRHASEIGAHVAGFNAESLAICMVGTNVFSRMQWVALGDLLQGQGSQTELFKIPVRSPTRDLVGGKVIVRDGICGHRDLSPDQNRNGIIESQEWLKTCPGFDVAAYLKAGLMPRPENVASLTPESGEKGPLI